MLISLHPQAITRTVDDIHTVAAIHRQVRESVTVEIRPQRLGPLKLLTRNLIRFRTAAAVVKRIRTANPTMASMTLGRQTTSGNLAWSSDMFAIPPGRLS